MKGSCLYRIGVLDAEDALKDVPRVR